MIALSSRLVGGRDHRHAAGAAGALERTALALALLVGAAANAAAQPVVSAARIDEPPTIDGLLTDDVWRRAAHLSDFVQTAPVEGAAASEPTDVYIAYDGENLYVGIRARYASPDLMRANRSDRDQIAEDDTVSLFFDPFRDRQRAYQFTVNGFGVQGDAILNSTGLRNRTQRRALGSQGRGPSDTPPSGIPEGDISWDALFVSAGVPSAGRLDRGAGDPVQEPALPVCRGGRDAPLGIPGLAGDSGEGRDRRLVAGLPGYRAVSRPDGGDRRAVRPVDQPQPGDPADGHRVPSRRARCRRRLRRRRHRRGRAQPEVRHLVGPDRRLHRQSRLLADRIGPAADRRQPALSALLSRAAAVLPGGAGDLQRLRADHADPHPDHRRSRATAAR